LIRELLPPETGLAFEAMHALRTSLAGEDDFVRRVDELQRPEGYRLVASFDEGEQRAAAVAGFRLAHNLPWGRFLYVDDLSTVPAARGRGHARRLLDWIEEEAGRLGCDQIHLDSGVGPSRWDAHRLYLSSGFAISSHHFVRELPGS